jgi:hypothetical protein
MAFSVSPNFRIDRGSLPAASISSLMFPEGVRGIRAHKTLKQCMHCLTGAVTVDLENADSTSCFDSTARSVSDHPTLLLAGCSCINPAVALVARCPASAGSGVAVTPSSKPTIRPSQTSPKYCVAISVGSPGPMSPAD